MSEQQRPIADRVADVVFFGPLGLALEFRKVMPQMARRGRRQVAFTRMIGKFTVRQGTRQVTEAVSGLLRAPEPPPAPLRVVPEPDLAPARADTETSAAGDVVATPEDDTDQASATDRLAIPQYDSLSAIQVVPRLEGLAEGELLQIRDYETATRSRRTILAKISQLQQ